MSRALPNPPDGALIHYYLKADARGPVTLEILDAAGAVVRKYSSDDPEDAPLPNPNFPDYWIRPWQPLSAKAGLHRFVWDVRYPHARRRHLQLSDRGGAVQHAEAARGRVGAAGHLQRAVDGGRQGADAAARAEDGPAREDAARWGSRRSSTRRGRSTWPSTKSHDAMMQARAATGEAAQKAAGNCSD